MTAQKWSSDAKAADWEGTPGVCALDGVMLDVAGRVGAS